jgi:hypothetical protein
MVAAGTKNARSQGSVGGQIEVWMLNIGLRDASFDMMPELKYTYDRTATNGTMTM